MVNKAETVRSWAIDDGDQGEGIAGFKRERIVMCSGHMVTQSLALRALKTQAYITKQRRT